MVKIQARKSVGRAVSYFLRDPDLSVQEKTGRWIGTGALAIGLGDVPAAATTNTGKIVDEADLSAVLSGYGPPSSSNGQSGRRLNGRYVANARRCAWDVVLSPHKSISVAGLCLPAEYDPPKVVCDAFSLAVQDTFAFLESLARRANGYRPDVVTGSLIAASFRHETSRRNDPQLHQHLLTMNATRDLSGQGREWYALEPLQLYKQARAVDMVFQRELHRHLRNTGLDSRMMTVDGLPVAVLPAVTPEICRRLSRAHQAILEETAGRWTRAERSHYQMRWENVINDRLRPAKTGQLIQRSDRFERALSTSEATKIAAAVQIPTLMFDAPARQTELTPDVIKAAYKKAAALVGDDVYNPRTHTLAAWYASMLHPEQPFALFRRFVAENAGQILHEPNDLPTMAMHALDQERAWLENEAHLVAQPPVAETSKPTITPPGMVPDHQQSSDRPAVRSQLPGYEKDDARAVAKSDRQTNAGSAHLPEAVPISEYWLPPPPEDSPDLSPGLGP